MSKLSREFEKDIARTKKAERELAEGINNLNEEYETIKKNIKDDNLLKKLTDAYQKASVSNSAGLLQLHNIAVYKRQCLNYIRLLEAVDRKNNEIRSEMRKNNQKYQLIKYEILGDEND